MPANLYIRFVPERVHTLRWSGSSCLYHYCHFSSDIQFVVDFLSLFHDSVEEFFLFFFSVLFHLC